MKLIISGGGTGGHIYPALAIVEEWKRRHPDAEILYVGTATGLEADIVPRTGTPFTAIEVAGLPRKISAKTVRAGIKLLKGLRESDGILKSFRPDIVVGTGGFVSFPIVYRAAKRKIPTLIHEQNGVAGISNRMLGKVVDRVLLTIPESERFFARKEILSVVGNPIRQIFFEKREKNYDEFGLDPEKKTVLIFGGSNGSESLNRAVVDILKDFHGAYNLIFVPGKSDYETVIRAVGEKPSVTILPYLYDMPGAYAIADLVVTASGAITLSEIAASHLPSILVPKAYTTENHQEMNARYFEKHGAARVLLEKELTGETLRTMMEELLESDLGAMAEAAGKLATPNAHRDIADAMEELIAR